MTTRAREEVSILSSSRRVSGRMMQGVEWHQESEFQSSLHRGGCPDTRLAQLCRLPELKCFNPLFIEAGVRTMSSTTCQRSRAEVSILSSSRRVSGRRESSAERRWDLCGFNPLFIEAGVRTDEDRPVCSRRSQVSILSSSRRVSGHTSADCSELPSASFNPLFIEAGVGQLASLADSDVDPASVSILSSSRRVSGHDSTAMLTQAATDVSILSSSRQVSGRWMDRGRQ